MKGSTCIWIAGAALLASARVAVAGPATVVPSSADPGDAFDLNLWIDYEYELRRSVVRRESAGDGTPIGSPLSLRGDLDFRSTRQLVVPRAELALYHDLWAYAALPMVIADSRKLSFADGIDRGSSSTIADGLLPMNGFDAGNPTAGFASGDTIFRGPKRRGLDQLHVGLGWAPMNQVRDRTKPTWKVGGEARISIGRPARFDRDDPGSQTGVGSGVHELRLWTSFARRLGWAEPYMEIWWQTPFATKRGSPFRDPGFGSERTGKQQEAGLTFGGEAYLVNRADSANKISIDASARVISKFEGRGYSDLWEVLAYAGDTTSGGPLILDADPTSTGVQPLAHPGISNIENYLELGGRLAIRAEIGPKIRLSAFAQLVTETVHFVTFADAGVDLPTCDATRSTGCELDSNLLVNPGTAEVNPLHVDIIDLVGHRYLVDGVFSVSAGLEAAVLF